jgi:hypothetical protein
VWGCTSTPQERAGAHINTDADSCVLLLLVVVVLLGVAQVPAVGSLVPSSSRVPTATPVHRGCWWRVATWRERDTAWMIMTGAYSCILQCSNGLVLTATNLIATAAAPV